MYLIVIAWCYVTAMMAIAEATSTQGSILGAIITFVLYGVLPMAILIYILSTPARKRRLQARRQAEQAASETVQREALQDVPSDTPNTSGHTPRTTKAAGIAPVREKS
jgi:membrane protein implicated in regulation of membrane protease activity